MSRYKLKRLSRSKVSGSSQSMEKQWVADQIRSARRRRAIEVVELFFSKDAPKNTPKREELL